MIGVSMGLGVWTTIGLATLLALFFGLALAVWPIMRAASLGLGAALGAIWLGEVISILVMEVVMNAVDYWAGGMTAMSVASRPFWRGILLAVPAGFLAAWPVNHWLIARAIKAH